MHNLAKADKERKRVERLETALRGLTEFSWSAVTADCEEARIELNKRLEGARLALSVGAP
jgi:hypothetical protein